MSKIFIKRILSSIFLILILIFFMFLDEKVFNFFLILLFLISCYEFNTIIRNKFLLFLSIILLSFSFFSAYSLKTDYGLNLFFYILSISISTDIGGYIFGKILKGPKLTKISPNKTYAGVFGSFLTSFFIGIFLFNFLKISIHIQIFNFKILYLIFLLSFVSQLGDLIISYLKRQSNLKDTGKLIPGHGGLLDRIDGVIFVFPFYYILTINM